MAHPITLAADKTAGIGYYDEIKVIRGQEMRSGDEVKVWEEISRSNQNELNLNSFGSKILSWEERRVRVDEKRLNQRGEDWIRFRVRLRYNFKANVRLRCNGKTASYHIIGKKTRFNR